MKAGLVHIDPVRSLPGIIETGEDGNVDAEVAEIARGQDRGLGSAPGQRGDELGHTHGGH